MGNYNKVNMYPAIDMAPEIKKGDSREVFKKTVEGQAESNGVAVVEKISGKDGLGADSAVNQDALTKLMSGQGAGDVLGGITIGIGFLQNLGTVSQIGIPWPESFRKIVGWLEIFSLDFSVFGGEQLGLWTSIMAGLLVSPWLIYMFDRSWRTGSRLQSLNVHSLNGNENKSWSLLVSGLVFCLFIFSLTFAVAGTAMSWYNSDILNTLFLVLSAFFFFEWIVYAYFLYRMMSKCDMANEDYGKKRQQSDMFIFLFLYPIAYLSGASACTTMLMMDDAAYSVMGYIFLPFYVLFPILYLWRIAKEVKATLAGGVDGPDYEASLEEIHRKAKRDVVTNPKTGTDRQEQNLPTDSSGYKAAVVSGLLGSFEEKYWWWKVTSS